MQTHETQLKMIAGMENSSVLNDAELDEYLNEYEPISQKKMEDYDRNLTKWFESL